MRRVVVLLLCLGLSFPAWAGLLAAGPCCPAKAEMAERIVEAAHSGDKLPDCCNDLATYLQTGQTCKSGTAASAPLLGWPAGGLLDIGLPALRAAPIAHGPSMASAEPGGIWRPPL